MSTKPIIAILLGDAAGVGAEIAAQCAEKKFFEEYCRPVILGDKRVFERAVKVTGTNPKVQVIADVKEADWTQGIPLLDMKNLNPEEVPFGVKTTVSGKACLEMIDKAVALYQEKEIDGFCFLPLNKAAMKDAGCKYESEHHYIAHLIHHTEPFGEINVCENVWTTRTTSHIPISEVSKNLTEETIGRAIRLSNTTLLNAGIKTPRIAVAALNPHAGEAGTCGREEIDVIAPAVESANKSGIHAEGPFSSDILFIKAFRGEYDGVVTMYHDQGQIALKLKGFDQGITIAGGFKLPIVTCGHGTAYDIAGKGIVRTSAFENAVQMAVQMANHNRNTK